MINIYYTYFEHQWSESDYKKVLSLLPVFEKEKNLKFIRWQDRQLGALGKLLLHYGLKEMTQEQSLDQVLTGRNGKPYLESGPYFNISHSGNYAICIISTVGEVGIDIEEMKAIEFEEFKSVFTQKEWRLIQTQDYAPSLFYEFWTKKEAVIKADGKGLTIPLSRIDATTDTVECQGRTWMTQELLLDPRYKSHVAAAVFTELRLRKIDDLSTLL